jgi:hypothetical protein
MKTLMRSQWNLKNTRIYANAVALTTNIVINIRTNILMVISALTKIAPPIVIRKIPNPYL